MHLHSIDTSISGMSDFIQSLLSYGHVGSGELKLQDCDCASVLNDVRLNLTTDVQQSCITISNDPLPVIRADPILVTQLFQNLIENGIKYRREETPRIHVAATPQSDGWLFSVRDNGIGVHPEDYERIFKPFCQSDGYKSLENGVGLGLATCKKIVERHGGQITVQSTLGEGATFTFSMLTA
jgi:light-regulated signal transduction histidine kinase (bacteriophytochrome)